MSVSIESTAFAVNDMTRNMVNAAEKTVMDAHQLQITIVVDNKAVPGLMSEHGLSFRIEIGGRRILFDTGQGGALEPNARALGIDLDETDHLILSHGHRDHTGGIFQVLRHARNADVYCHSGIVKPRYSIRNGTTNQIQMPPNSMAAIDKVASRQLHWVLHPVMITETIGLTGFIPREMGYEDTGGPFYLDPAGRRPDMIEDDLALWISTSDGLVICVGCCHAGLVNTLNHIRRFNPGVRVRAIIGGFHLRNAGSRRLEQTIAALKSANPDLVVPCHCTGEPAVAALRVALGKRVTPGVAGMTFQF